MNFLISAASIRLHPIYLIFPTAYISVYAASVCHFFATSSEHVVCRPIPIPPAFRLVTPKELAVPSTIFPNLLRSYWTVSAITDYEDPI